MKCIFYITNEIKKGQIQEDYGHVLIKNFSVLRNLEISYLSTFIFLY